MKKINYFEHNLLFLVIRTIPELEEYSSFNINNFWNFLKNIIIIFKILFQITNETTSNRALDSIEIISIAWFLVESLIRFLVCPIRINYWKKTSNIIDTFVLFSMVYIENIEYK